VVFWDNSCDNSEIFLLQKEVTESWQVVREANLVENY